MRVAVFGAGGVGGYFGARLAEAGHDVAFVARGAHLEAIQEHGLRLESVKGDVHLRPARATDRPEEIGAVDLILIAVKSWQLAGALPAMPPLVGPRTIALPLLNGVEAVDEAGLALGRERVLGGVCWIRAEVAAPGLIRHPGIEPRVVVGEPAGGASPRAEGVAEALRRAGVRAESTGDIRSVLWSKLVFISPTSAVGAVARVPIDELRTIPATRALLVQVMEETMAVARGHGVALPPGLLQQTMDYVDALPADTTSSMQRDVMAGRVSELEAQCGAVVRLGRAVRVAAPANEALYSALLPQEQRARRAAGLHDKFPAR